MPKGILEFDLTEEGTEHLLAVHGSDWACVAWRLDQRLSDWLKHGHEFENADAALEAVHTELRSCLEYHGVSFEMM